MIRTAVILTVYNRRDITLRGLRSLYKAIVALGGGYDFDIFMTDDGCTDGTAEAVNKEFPDIRIVRGDGSLYWGGGMRLAWQAAIDTNNNYDYYLWFNDDSDLFENALVDMFGCIKDDYIITGAFSDISNRPSYGGKYDDKRIMVPNGELQEVRLMNGNLVLIPQKIYLTLGMINKYMKHCGGDHDYGFRAKEQGFKVLLTKEYVGIAERHDSFIPIYCSQELSFRERWQKLHTPINNPFGRIRFGIAYYGFFKTAFSFFSSYIGVFFPILYIKCKKLKENH